MNRDSPRSPLVILLCGLPGSGKSTLSTELRSLLQPYSLTDYLRVVSFDEIGSKVTWGCNSFSVIRHHALSILSEYLCLPLAVSPSLRCVEMPSRLLQTFFDRFGSVILVDDTMQLRSMRREVYMRVRDANAALFTVFVQTPIDCARRRNSARVGQARVSDDGFERLAQSFQWVNPQWVFDRYSTTVSMDDLHIASNVALQVIESIIEMDVTPLIAAPALVTIQQSKGRLQLLDERIRKWIASWISGSNGLTSRKDLGKLCAIAKADTVRMARTVNEDKIFENDTEFEDSMMDWFVSTLQHSLGSDGTAALGWAPSTIQDSV